VVVKREWAMSAFSKDILNKTQMCTDAQRLWDMQEHNSFSLSAELPVSSVFLGVKDLTCGNMLGLYPLAEFEQFDGSRC